MPPEASGPVSGVVLPLVSTSGVTPSLLKSEKTVPAGKVELATVMSNESVPLPLFTTGLVKLTVAPCGALAMVWPVMVTPVLGATVKMGVFVVNGPTGVPVPGS